MGRFLECLTAATGRREEKAVTGRRTPKSRLLSAWHRLSLALGSALRSLDQCFSDFPGVTPLQSPLKFRVASCCCTQWFSSQEFDRIKVLPSLTAFNVW